MSDSKLKQKKVTSLRRKPTPTSTSSSSSSKPIYNTSLNKSTTALFDMNQLKKELEDPNNEHLKDSITSIMKIKYGITEISKSFEKIKETKSFEENQINSLPNYQAFTSLYTYTSYLKGLNDIVIEFLSKTQSIKKGKTNAKEEFSKECLLKLETLYQVLGHDSYSKLLSLYEKYCEYGKTLTNFNLEYSQFNMMMTKNKLYTNEITKEKCEVLYNKAKQNNKAITFETFIDILSDISILVFNIKDSNWMNSVKYYYSAYISSIPCLKKTMFEKELERLYFNLESEDITSEVNKYLAGLYTEYCLNTISDFRYGEVMDLHGLINLCKRKQVIPIFMSGKELIEILDFIKYKKKRLMPTNKFDFLVFAEVICMIGLQSYSKYIKEENLVIHNKDKKPIASQSERVIMFIKFILNKV